MGGVAVIVRDGKHLLIKQSKNKASAGEWQHPGGKFEPGESYADGLKRELKEELGIEIEIDGEPFYIAKSNYHPGYFGFFEARWKSGDIKIDKKEADEFGWFDSEEIKKLPLMKQTQSAFIKLLKNK